MQDFTTTLALLAPIPENLLVDGFEVCIREGEVAYGSRAFEVFRQLDELAVGRPVRTLIYASHSDGKRAALVTWTARYLRHVEAIRNGRHPEGLQFRPTVGRDAPGENRGHWAVYWHVDRLCRLDDPIVISDLRGLNSQRCYSKDFVPEGPLLVEFPPQS